GFGWVEDAFEDLGPRGLLADLAQVRPERAADARDTVAVDALHPGRLEEQLAPAPRVPLEGQEQLGADHTPQAFDALLVGQEALEQVSDLGVTGRHRRGQHLRADRFRDAPVPQRIDEYQSAPRRGQQPANGDGALGGARLDAGLVR